MNLLLSLLCIVGILCALWIIYEAACLWLLPLFAEYPATVCFAASALLLLGVWMLRRMKANDPDFP